jgi:hypothetical protein
MKVVFAPSQKNGIHFALIMVMRALSIIEQLKIRAPASRGYTSLGDRSHPRRGGSSRKYVVLLICEFWLNIDARLQNYYTYSSSRCDRYFPALWSFCHYILSAVGSAVGTAVHSVTNGPQLSITGECRWQLRCPAMPVIEAQLTSVDFL